MPLSWNEIKDRALAFSREWADESSEDAEAKSFWDAFFNVFGITRRRIASFETPVKKSDGKGGYIDLLWRGMLLIEHKSRGKDLSRAEHQAFDYFTGLKERDLPRFVVVSDFARIRLYDLEEGGEHEFALRDLHKNVRHFGFIAGYQTHSFGQQDPVNVQAVERLGRLHDQLKASGYDGHALEVFLVRLLFCLFAEDTAIFEQRQFLDWIEQRTAEDGSDLGPLLAQLFQVLDTPHERRQKKLDEQLAAFPYVNGKLFAEQLPLTSFDTAMRNTLLECCSLNWSRISPAVFGSLFQSIMDETARREIGAHYTTEANILKVLRPLFLDSLRAEFERIKNTPKALPAFHKKLATTRVFDPACGCGNFLVIAYRELRMLELDVLQAIEHSRQTQHLDFNLSSLVQVDVDQFCGIEIEEFPAQIAQVALWLMDHQMNLRVSEEFGNYFVRLPLKKAPVIVNGNALATDWRQVLAPADCSFIVGNPPFIGAKLVSAEQRADMDAVFLGNKNSGQIDYVACWYRKATDYMAANPRIVTAFVSTNSITQGEQVGALWPDLLASGVRIQFAHRTFQWSSEARGKATVQCVIIGFALEDKGEKWLFDYVTPRDDPHAIRAQNINPYLIDAPNVIAIGRMKPLCAVPAMANGSIPADGGNLILEPREKDELIAAEPAAEEWVRLYVGAEGFIHNIERWCLWLRGCPPAILHAMPKVRERVAAVKMMRAASSKAATREKAQTPSIFTEIRQPDSGSYLALPRTSSENRQCIPIGYLPATTIAANDLQIIPGADEYTFGVLSSAMHMAWVRVTAGRLESRYRYSAKYTYNTFPWPDPGPKERDAVMKAARGVLAARALHPGATMADLYDPLAMPPELSAAHRTLDKAVDAAYGKRSFAGEAERVSFLFQIYQRLTATV
jgi:hypothetical protein